MKRLALLLVVANLALWVFGTLMRPGSLPVGPDSAEGRLPRVAELELLSDPEMVTDQDAVSEQGAPIGAEIAVADDSITGPELPSPERFCVRLGWFEAAEEAGEAAALIRGELDGREVTVTEEASPLPPFFWVIIPPSASREAAQQRLTEIQRRGIDSFLVVEGEQANAISLGLFESREAAEQLLAQRNAENLHAVLALFPRNHISYALVFEASYVPGSQELLADQAEFSDRFELVEINGCESVATQKKTP